MKIVMKDFNDSKEKVMHRKKGEVPEGMYI